MDQKKIAEIYAKFLEASANPTEREKEIMKHQNVHDITGRINHPF